MGAIRESVVVDGNREEVFGRIKGIEFIKRIDPNAGQDTEVVLDTARVLRSVSLVDKVGTIETERVIIPELFSIVSQRRGSMSPFLYQIAIQMLEDAGARTVLKWIVDFELEDRMKDREAYFSSIIRSHARENLERARQYLAAP
jgi:hypothetical protein